MGWAGSMEKWSHGPKESVFFLRVKNFEQENYAFYIDMDVAGQAFSFECRGAQNGGYRADQNVKVVSSTSISNQGSSYTIAELEDYFNDDSVV